MGLIPKKLLHILVIALALLVTGAANPACAQEEAPSVPVIQSSFIHNDARITFEWPQPVTFATEVNGKVVTIIFARKANPDFNSLLSSLYPFVISAHQKKDGKTIVLTLDKPYKIRTFMSDNVGGVDLLDIDQKKRRGVASSQDIFSKLAPAAGAEGDSKNATAPASADTATTPASAAATSPATPEPAAAATAPSTRIKGDINDTEAIPTDKKPADQNVEATRPANVTATVASDSAKSSTVKVSVSASDDNATIRLPFKERMAVAAYVRNGFLWIVLNKPVKLDLADFADLPRTVIGKAELVSGLRNVIKIPITDDTVRPYVAKEESSFEWAIVLTPTPKSLSNALKVNINTDPPAPPHVFIPSLEMGDPIAMKDPVVGDDLVVTPLFKAGEAVPFTRDFVEFTLLESAQGIVVAKKADAASVISLRNGLRISLPQGATLTPGLPEVEKSNATKILQNISTLFPYNDWKLDVGSTRFVQINTLFHQIVEAKNDQDANDHRLRLAQIYLSEGLGAEAIGMLDGISRTSPVFYKASKLAALRGAANFLMSRFRDAAKDFAASELNNNKETDYWRSMLTDLNGKSGQYNYMEMNDDYISKYPPSFRQKLSVVAADRAVDAKEYNTAIKIFETLKPGIAGDKTEDQPKNAAKKEKKELPPDDIMAPINSYVNFILAKIAVSTGQLEEGLTSWNELAEDISHPLVQAHAEFSRVVWQLNHNALTKTQAIERLEKLRLAWHGDSLELKIITLVGELYFEQKDYVNAMRMWDNGINAFPDTPNAVDMNTKMEEGFILLFGEGNADALNSVQALSLYYQYKKYAPNGAIGREMLNKLADRLVAVDLLDQAAGLLEHQMHFEAEKVQRSQLGAKVATIHLLNHQPKRALNALQDSVYGENPAQLRQLRNRLTAQALFDMGENDKSYLILGQDDSPDADVIRLNIYWSRKDWKQVIPIVENLLKTRKDTSAPITLEESEYVLKLGLAYVFENNTAQLDYLHDYFSPLMASNPNKGIFEFITAKDFSPTPSNFDEVVVKLSDTRSFINNYRARIETSGLGAIVPPLPTK